MSDQPRRSERHNSRRLRKLPEDVQRSENVTFKSLSQKFRVPERELTASGNRSPQLIVGSSSKAPFWWRQDGVYLSDPRAASHLLISLEAHP